MACASGVAKSNATDRFDLLQVAHNALIPSRRDPRWRIVSPNPGGSILTTSAPWSPSIIAASGAVIMVPASTTRIPSSVPIMGFCQGPGCHTGSDDSTTQRNLS